MGSLQLFIRHPEQIAIHLSATTRTNALQPTEGPGLICQSDTHWPEGSAIEIQYPGNDNSPDITLTGTVRYCFSRETHYELLIQFDSPEDRMKLRMAEQQAHIQLYKTQLEQRDGCSLSDNEAAARWIRRYANVFPGAQG